MYENNLIVLPDLSEACLAASLHAKLNSIVSDNTRIDELILGDPSEDIAYKYFLTEEDPYIELPTAKEWEGEYPYWPGCWWFRKDTTTMDKNAADKEEYDNWLVLCEDENINELHTATFTEIERQVAAMIKGEMPSAGELLEVDFNKGNAWQPRIV